MPTAIIRNYTGEAFVVAADGMAEGTKPTLSRRKIFKFGGNKWLAYAFAGRVAIGPEEGPETWFDFRERIHEAVQALSPDRSQTLFQYATDLADHAHRALIETCSTDQITFDDGAALRISLPLASVFINGYFKQIPSSVIVEFWRDNNQFAKPKISVDELIVGIPRRHGSYVIDAYLHQDHPPFSNERYLRPLETPLPHFSEAMQRAVLDSRRYIEVCSSPEARALDDFCKTIGGKIHMASVTPNDGFDWVPGFEPPNG